MNKLIIASVLCLGFGTQAMNPALAYGVRHYPAFDPAAELARTTGAAQMPESHGGFVQQARPLQTGSEALPRGYGSVPHSGVDMMIGGSSRYPVLSQDTLNHLPTGLSQDQVLVDDFRG